MSRKVKSMRGEIVDFDLMEIKQQISSAEAPLEVKTRQDFIENRMKRRIKKAINEIPVDVEPNMPSADEEDEATVNENKKESDAKKPVKKTRQKVKTRKVENKEDNIANEPEADKK